MHTYADHRTVTLNTGLQGEIQRQGQEQTRREEATSLSVTMLPMHSHVILTKLVNSLIALRQTADLSRV